MMRRRGFLAGLGALLAAPAIIRTPGLLMPVKPLALGRPAQDFAPVFEDELFMNGVRVPLGLDAGLKTFNEAGGMEAIGRDDPLLSRDQYGNLVRLGGWHPYDSTFTKADAQRMYYAEANLAQKRYLETHDERAADDARNLIKIARMQVA